MLVASSFRNIVSGVAKFEVDCGLRMPSDVETIVVRLMSGRFPTAIGTSLTRSTLAGTSRTGSEVVCR